MRFFMMIWVACASAHADIATHVETLQSWFGEPQILKTRSAESEAMVRELIAVRHRDERFSFVTGSPSMEVGSGTVAGTVYPNVARASLVVGLRKLLDREELRAALPDLHDAVTGLLADGAAFGFDGGAKNACDDDEPYLIVLDEENRTAYGLGLLPCE